MSIEGELEFPSLAGVTGANYVFAYDTTTQVVATENTFQNLTFNTNVLLDGWTHSEGTNIFVCNQTGKYIVTINSNYHRREDLFLARAELRALFNNSEVAGSQVAVEDIFRDVSLSTTFMISAVTAQSLKIEFTGTTNTELKPLGAGITTQSSAKITIMRIA